MKCNIKEFRKESGFSLRAMGEMCRISFTHLSQMEQGKSLPRIDTAYRVARILDKSIFEIWPDETEIVREEVTVIRVR